MSLFASHAEIVEAVECNGLDVLEAYWARRAARWVIKEAAWQDHHPRAPRDPGRHKRYRARMKLDPEWVERERQRHREYRKAPAPPRETKRAPQNVQPLELERRRSCIVFDDDTPPGAA